MSCRRFVIVLLAVLVVSPGLAGARRGEAGDRAGDEERGAPPPEIVIQAAALEPSLLRAGIDERVTFVNRSGRIVHVEFIGEDGLHHVFQVPGSIWAEFHRPGRHPYVVHFAAGAPPELRGAVDVGVDGDRVPTAVCGGFTVSDVCIAP